MTKHLGDIIYKYEQEFNARMKQAKFERSRAQNTNFSFFTMGLALGLLIFYTIFLD